METIILHTTTVDELITKIREIIKEELKPPPSTVSILQGGRS